MHRGEIEQMWELHPTTDDSHPDCLTIVEAAAWVAIFPGTGATTPLQVVQQSVRAIWDAVPRSSDPGSLDQLLDVAANAVAGLSSLDVDPVHKPQVTASLTEASARLFFARGRARTDGYFDIAERLTELLSILNDCAAPVSAAVLGVPVR